MTIGFFLRFIYSSLIILSLSIPLSAGGGKDKVLEQSLPLEIQQEEPQEDSQNLEKNDIKVGEGDRASQEVLEEGGEETPQEVLEEGVQETSQDPELETPENEVPVPQMLRDGKGNPRLHLYDVEETAVLSTNSSKNMVKKATGSFSQIIFDEKYRLQSRLTWQEGDTSPKEGENYYEPSKIISQEDYFYYDESRNRQKVVLTNFKDVSRKESYYSQEGLLLKEELYIHVPEQEENTDNSQNKNNKAQEKKNINEVKNTEDFLPKDLPLDPWAGFPSLSLVQVTEYQYNQDKALTEKKLTHHREEEALVEKTVYQNPGDIHGGYDYFENDELLISRKYLDENQYTETRYFDNMRVETLYNGSRLILEVIYLDGNEIRRTEF